MVVLESGSGDAVTDAEVVGDAVVVAGDDDLSQTVVVAVVGGEVVVVGGDYHPVDAGPVCDASSHSYGFSVRDLHIA